MSESEYSEESYYEEVSEYEEYVEGDEEDAMEESAVYPSSSPTTAQQSGDSKVTYPSGNVSDQIAALAAARSARSTEQNGNSTPPAHESPKKVAPSISSPQPPANRAAARPKKIVYHIPAKGSSAPANEPENHSQSSTPAFAKVQLRKTTPAPSVSQSSTKDDEQDGTMFKAKLRRNGGIDVAEPSKQVQQEKPEQAVELGPDAKPLVNVPYQETDTETRRVVSKRVIRHDPEYETVEYKIGCLCTVL